MLNRFAQRVNPWLPRIREAGFRGYSWVREQCEAATNIMARRRTSRTPPPARRPRAASDPVRDRRPRRLSLLTLRLRPFVSFNLVHCAAGLSEVDWPTPLWTMAPMGLGILPFDVLLRLLGPRAARGRPPAVRDVSLQALPPRPPTNRASPDTTVTVEVRVGVAYGTDMNLARRAMLTVARPCPDVSPAPEPTVYFSAFGDSSLQLQLWAYVADYRRQAATLDTPNRGVLYAFRREGIEIPFPQQVVTLRCPEVRAAGHGRAAGQAIQRRGRARNGLTRQQARAARWAEPRGRLDAPAFSGARGAAAAGFIGEAPDNEFAYRPGRAPRHHVQQQVVLRHDDGVAVGCERLPGAMDRYYQHAGWKAHLAQGTVHVRGGGRHLHPHEGPVPGPRGRMRLRGGRRHAELRFQDLQDVDTPQDPEQAPRIPRIQHRQLADLRLIQTVHGLAQRFVHQRAAPEHGGPRAEARMRWRPGPAGHLPGAPCGQPHGLDRSRKVPPLTVAVRRHASACPGGTRRVPKGRGGHGGADAGQADEVRRTVQVWLHQDVRPVLPRRRPVRLWVRKGLPRLLRCEGAEETQGVSEPASAAPGSMPGAFDGTAVDELAGEVHPATRSCSSEGPRASTPPADAQTAMAAAPSSQNPARYAHGHAGPREPASDRTASGAAAAAARPTPTAVPMPSPPPRAADAAGVRVQQDAHHHLRMVRRVAMRVVVGLHDRAQVEVLHHVGDEVPLMFRGTHSLSEGGSSISWERC